VQRRAFSFLLGEQQAGLENRVQGKLARKSCGSANATGPDHQMDQPEAGLESEGDFPCAAAG
jgi:hypothetical protein